MDEWTIRDLTAWAHRAVVHVNASGDLHTKKGVLTEYGHQINDELAIADSHVRWLHGG